MAKQPKGREDRDEITGTSKRDLAPHDGHGGSYPRTKDDLFGGGQGVPGRTHSQGNGMTGTGQHDDPATGTLRKAGDQGLRDGPSKAKADPDGSGREGTSYRGEGAGREAGDDDQGVAGATP